MPMVCPQCNASYEQRLQCPNCGTRLLYQAPLDRGDVSSWQQTPWGRIAIGLLLAQGLYYGLRQLCLAALLAMNEDASHGRDVYRTIGGLVLLQALQAIGV